MISAKLIDVVVEPGQIETIETEANQIEERLNVVNGSGSRVHAKLAHRSKHRVALESFNRASSIYSLSEGKVDEVVPALVETNII